MKIPKYRATVVLLCTSVLIASAVYFYQKPPSDCIAMGSFASQVVKSKQAGNSMAGVFSALEITEKDQLVRGIVFDMYILQTPNITPDEAYTRWVNICLESKESIK